MKAYGKQMKHWFYALFKHRQSQCRFQTVVGQVQMETGVTGVVFVVIQVVLSLTAAV